MELFRRKGRGVAHLVRRRGAVLESGDVFDAFDAEAADALGAEFDDGQAVFANGDFFVAAREVAGS